MAEWARIDVNFFRHPQVSALRPAECLGYLAMILYAQEHETDGHVPQEALRWCDVKPSHAQAMQAAGLVEEVFGGWQIIGFLNHQRSRAEMEAARKTASARARKGASARWHKDSASMDEVMP